MTINLHLIMRCTASIVLLAATVYGASGQKEILLFTEGEADALRIEENQWEPVPRARSATLGPLIVVAAPEVRRGDGSETIETKSPTSMTVVFEENEAPVNMSSLEIVAKKGLFSKSLTELLRPYLAGTTLTVESLAVPSGNYQIQILVEDLEGRESMRMYRLIVED